MCTAPAPTKAEEPQDALRGDCIANRPRAAQPLTPAMTIPANRNPYGT